MTETEKKVVKLTEARASYPYIYGEGRKQAAGKKPRWESTFLLDPSRVDHQKQILEIKQEVARVAREFHGDKIDIKKIKLPFSTLADDAQFCPGFFAVQAWSNERPLVVSRARVPTVKETDNEGVFAGAWLNTNLTFFGWSFVDQETKMTKKGVSANLRAIQYVKGDPSTDRFGGRAPIDVEDEFEALGDAADANTPAGKDPFDD